jgi:cytochrome c5
MKNLKISAILVLLAACGGSKSTTSTPTPVQTKDVAVSETSTAMTDTERAGKVVYEANCAKCHKLHEPKSFSAEEWKPIVLRMQKKAKISDEQREMVYAYLVR